VPALPARARYGPGIAAGILITSMLLPPVAAYARQYAYAQALQFLIFAVAGPALLVLGTPWRSRPPTWRPGSGGRPRGPGGRAAIRLVAFSPAPRLAFTTHPAVKTIQAHACRRNEAEARYIRAIAAGRSRPTRSAPQNGDSQMALCYSGLCSRRPKRSASAGNSAGLGADM
jgi:hypothetical protein